jgi:hypothetical protein
VEDAGLSHRQMQQCSAYYAAWLDALEALLAERGLLP